ncbi:MAG: RNA polymerase factor sigma-54 [Gammaproteobacteria bacterium]|jgi:RNA polymerase sigma-54 factor
MKPGLQLRIGQQLTLTPQLRQALHLLQLSSLELGTEIRQALEENVMLESGDAASQDAALPESAEPSAGEAHDELVQTDWDDAVPWTPSAVGSSAESGGPESMATPAYGLADHLLWQLELAPMSQTDQLIGAVIIDALDGDGYLREPLADLASALPTECEAGSEEIEAVLHRIQRFDPVGCGARDLAECLTVQLLELARPGRVRDLAARLIAKHLEALAGNDNRALVRRLGADAALLNEAMDMVRSLDPRPGARMNTERVEYVVPDVIVSRRDGGWNVELNPEATPQIRVNGEYAALLRSPRCRNGESTGLTDQLQQARWLVRGLRMRNETLLRVATAIVRHQHDFLERGEAAMKPLLLRDIAAQLDLHESTISRVTARKYMLTPRGVVEFRYFFSTQIRNDQGEDTSAVAVRALIRQLITEENPQKPMSDSRIAGELTRRGLKVARRTIAKYREAMAIPPSHERRQSQAR